MRAMPHNIEEQIVSAYRRMADEGLDRPAVASDVMGNITVSLERLDLDEEARRYAQRWWEEEEANTYFIGCANYPTRPTIYAIEAARLCCGGIPAEPVARRMLQMALRALEEYQ